MLETPSSTKKTPRYIEVASDLRGRIEAGEFQVGTVLPTETELCTAYEISRYTVREALRRLQDAGIVARRQGSGTVVTSREKAAIFQQELGSLDSLIQYASDVRFELDVPVTCSLPDDLQRFARGEDFESWIYRRAIAFQRHLRRPVALSHIFMPPKYAEIAKAVKGNEGALFNEFERLSGNDVERVEQEIRATVLSAEDCETLDAAGGSAGLRTIRVYYDSAGVAMASISYHPGDRYAYHVRFDRKV